MDADRLVLLQGLRDTRSTFERWAANPRAILVPWLAGALAIAAALLASVWVIAFDTALNANLTGCASNSSQATTSSDSESLVERFRQIGNQIGALRLVK